MTDSKSFGARFRTAAVSVDLALSAVERETIVERVKAGAPSLRMQPVAALIGMGLNYDDALAWCEPFFEEGLDEGWAEEAAAWLPRGEDPRAWLSVAVLGAAYLYGRSPAVEKVTGLARRAAFDGYPRLVTEEGQRLAAIYDKWSDRTIYGGMSTAPPPARPDVPGVPVAIRIIADALGRPVPQAGQFITGLFTLGGPGRERVTTTADPAEARWFDSAAEAHAYWTQQHGLRPWDGEPNRPLTAYSIEFVRRGDVLPD